MTVRCKLRCNSVRFFNQDNTGSREYTFGAVYDMSIPEDRRFQRATPYAEFKIMVDNPAVYDRFEVGRDYYFDMDEASSPEPAKTNGG